MSEIDDDLPVRDGGDEPPAIKSLRTTLMQSLLARGTTAAEPAYSQLLQVAKDALDGFIRTECMVDDSTWFEKLDKTPHREFHTLSKEAILLELHRERLCGIVAGARGKLTKNERTDALQAAADLVNTWPESRGVSSALDYEVPGHHTVYSERMLNFVITAVARAMQPAAKAPAMH